MYTVIIDVTENKRITEGPFSSLQQAVETRARILKSLINMNEINWNFKKRKLINEH